METALDLGGFSLYQPKLGGDLDLDGYRIKKNIYYISAFCEASSARS